jgi:hypothetical protein
MNGDPYVESIKRLGVVLMVLAATSVTLAVNDFDRATNLARAIALQIILATAHAVQSSEASKQGLLESDLAEVYMRAALEQLQVKSEQAHRKLKQAADPSRDATSEQIPPLPYGSINVPNALMLPAISLRFAPRTYCNASALKGADDYYSLVLSRMIEVSGGLVYGKDIYLVNFGWRCELEGLGLRSLLLIDASKVGGGDWMVALPSLAANLIERHDQRWSEVFGKDTIEINRDKFLSAQSQRTKGLVFLEQEYQIFPMRFFEIQAFEQSQKITGRFRDPKDLEGAMEDLWDVGQPSSNAFEGVPLTEKAYLALAPLIATALIFLILQRAAVILDFNHRTEQPWLLKDSKGALSRGVALASTALPLVCTVLVYASFAATNDTYALGHVEWSVVSLIGKPITLTRGDNLHVIYTSFIGVLFLVTLPLGILTSVKLVRLCRQSNN